MLFRKPIFIYFENHMNINKMYGQKAELFNVKGGYIWLPLCCERLQEIGDLTELHYYHCSGCLWC
jgi:hypothetical protein